ncbi:DUF4177 domain-containing protein [Tissierella sp. MB52-C2]|uniref:DUF4177 domain-containing protein n=1 Tax=Tissierella sp. MB52-C2 TaxID=3070999 RepID=UPI00280B274A|nr:DUF4177 domain-containing protein [Tissierella sp. MB52-C2]WMM23914.1 DUF4177 domain-containing protein [Tissierella sp. MB52-C2]
MYKYIYIEAQATGIMREGNHRELIDKYSKEGWRFVTAIPTRSNGHGVIKNFDLVFEKEDL